MTDFGDVRRRLLAGENVQGWHLHANGGGVVSDSATVPETASVGARASVGEWARVGARARVGEWARVGDGASVGGGARIANARELVCCDFLGFRFAAYPVKGGAIEVTYGCEMRSLDDWDTNLPSIVATHITAEHRDHYANALRTALGLARAVLVKAASVEACT